MAGSRKHRAASAIRPSRGSTKRKAQPAPQGQREANSSAPSLVIDLADVEHLRNVMYLLCYRARKFQRLRFARLLAERVANEPKTEALVAQLPVETMALFLGREVRLVPPEGAPINECFELPDGRLLEFVGEHLDVADTVLHLLSAYNEERLNHVVELLANHDRSWIYQLATETRDAYLADLGFAELDDAERLFAPWHARLLLRKLEAAASHLRHEPQPTSERLGSSALLAFVEALPEQERQLARARLHFLIACQVVRDAERKVLRLQPPLLQQSAQQALKTLARGVRHANRDLGWLRTAQMVTVFRLGLATAST